MTIVKIDVNKALNIHIAKDNHSLHLTNNNNMKTISFNATDSHIFPRIANTAKSGVFDGSTITPYFESCRWFVERYDCIIILTRDVGYHSSGWWRNPDYERCYHLSISFLNGRCINKLEHILTRFFGNNRRLLWCEPPYSKPGKQNEIYHYRLFCDEHWQPVKPKGEVYSTLFTELGWKSYSELHYKKI